jgi:hypothetical protein
MPWHLPDADGGGGCLYRHRVMHVQEECAPSEDGATAAESLANVLGGLSIGVGGAAGPLRGVPVAQVDVKLIASSYYC